MIDKLLTLLLGKPRHVGDPDDPLMLRWYIGKAPAWLGGREWRVHKLLRSDYDRDPHDHPYDFTSFILWGHYFETVFEALLCLGMKKRGLWSTARYPASHTHRLTLFHPCYTVVSTGPWLRNWGFWTPGGWVPEAVYESTHPRTPRVHDRQASGSGGRGDVSTS